MRTTVNHWTMRFMKLQIYVPYETNIKPGQRLRIIKTVTLNQEANGNLNSLSTKIQGHVNINLPYLHLMKITKIFCPVSKGRVHTRLKTSWNTLFLFMIYFICQNQRVSCHTDLSLHWHRSLFKIQSFKFRTQVKTATCTLHFPCHPRDYNWNI